MPFPYATATVSEIEERARSLVGRALIEIDPTAPMQPSSAQTKGRVGRIYESAFDIPPNSVAGPDFPGAGIELKSVPVLLTPGSAKAKERISVGMIDFDRLATEEWATAAVRKKIERMLVIFYAWEPLRPIASFRTLVAGIWEPDESTLAGIRSDWDLIAGLVRSGRRDDVSESLTTMLGAATKGPGHGSRSRAWSLKQPFVTWLYEVMRGREALPIGPIAANPEAAFETRVLEQLRPHIGQSLGALAASIGRPDLGGKAATSQIVRTLIGERPRGRHGDFERFGIETKVVPVDSRGTVVERMSFPAFIHEELVFEDWSTSDLLGRLNRLLIVPIHREKGAALADTVLGRPFFWSPTPTELDGIAEEWATYRNLIAAGGANQLPPASQTTYVHVRTHGRDATDREPAPGGFDVTRKSFWLNDRFLERILREHGVI